MHNRQRAAYLTLGARSRPRGHAGAARPEPGQDAPAPPDGRTSLRHDKVLDGIDALPDENAQARRHRNGAARPGLQHETGDAYAGRCRTDGSDPCVRRAARTRSRLPNHWRPRFYTTWTRNGHRRGRGAAGVQPTAKHHKMRGWPIGKTGKAAPMDIAIRRATDL